MPDMRKQVEELLSLNFTERIDSRNFNRAVRNVFPKLARHYLALLDENERLRLSLEFHRSLLTSSAAALAQADAKPLMKSVEEHLAEGCYCRPGHCMAPVIMGRQMPCRDPEKAHADAKENA